MKIRHESDYRRRRASEYPDLQELADALVHEAAGNSAPLKAYTDACQAVKAKFPKPASAKS